MFEKRVNTRRWDAESFPFRNKVKAVPIVVVAAEAE